MQYIFSNETTGSKFVKGFAIYLLPLCTNFSYKQILFERVTFDREELQEAIRIIDKDVPRTNRDLSYYQ